LKDEDDIGRDEDFGLSMKVWRWSDWWRRYDLYFIL